MVGVMKTEVDDQVIEAQLQREEGDTLKGGAVRRAIRVAR